MKTEFIQTIDNIETKKKISIYELLGLIKDGKAPKKIKYGNVIYQKVEGINNYKAINNVDLYLFDYNFFEYCRLNDNVEILDEEDEFIDIESFGVHYSWDYIDYKNIEELKKYVNKDFQRIFDTLDALIKNQKKIIERLDKNE